MRRHCGLLFGETKSNGAKHKVEPNNPRMLRLPTICREELACDS
jgi:hypothetical protein